MKKIDLTGHVFGKLTVLREAGKNKQGQYFWLCQCDCGEKARVNMSSLRHGGTISCGCHRGMPYGRKKKVGARGPRRKDLQGYKTGRLAVISFNSVNDHGDAIWNCICDCGSEFTTAGSRIINGITSSCGCLRREIHTKHDGCKRPEYTVWEGMIQRCTNPNAFGFERYGGRGIMVCDRWRDFGNFIADMGTRPSAEYSIERVDGNKSYEPGNCRWATKTEQQRNLGIFKTSKTGHPGVYYGPATKKYTASISVNDKTKYLGCFQTIGEAIQARKEGELQHWGKEIGI